jgi:hypothetical protein
VQTEAVTLLMISDLIGCVLVLGKKYFERSFTIPKIKSNLITKGQTAEKRLKGYSKRR